MTRLTLPAVLIIRNIVSVTVPPNAIILGLFNRVQQRAHPVCICRVRLHKVDDVKAVGMILSRVLHLEIVPLSEASRAIIILKV